MLRDQPFTVVLRTLVPERNKKRYRIVDKRAVVRNAVNRLLGELGYTNTPVLEHANILDCDVANALSGRKDVRKFDLDPSVVLSWVQPLVKTGVAIELCLTTSRFGTLDRGTPTRVPFFDTRWPMGVQNPAPTMVIDADCRPLIACSGFQALDHGKSVPELLVGLAVRSLAQLLVPSVPETGHDGGCIIANDATSPETLFALAARVAHGGPYVCDACNERLYESHAVAAHA